jgi:hypothetical protein
MLSQAPINSSSRPPIIHHNSPADIRPKVLPPSNILPLVSTNNSHMVHLRRNNNGRANHRNNILKEAIHHRSSIRLTLREHILRISILRRVNILHKANTLRRANILHLANIPHQDKANILLREVTRRRANPAIQPLTLLNQCPLHHP